MRTLNWRNGCGALPLGKTRNTPAFLALTSLFLFCLLTRPVHAFLLPPGSPPPALDYWSFTDTNNWPSYFGYAPVSFTNLNSSNLGNGNCLLLDSTNAAWLQYNVFENDGTTNLTVDFGTIMFWFAPSWASTNQGGNGPGQWGRLIEAGSYTTNASYGWFSLYTDPDGENLYFSTQTNDGSQADYFSAPIAWTSNRWHFVALTYSTSNSVLYVDGSRVTNGPPVSYRPGLDVLTNGFFIGSDSNGLAQARGMYDDLETYNVPLSAGYISNIGSAASMVYWANPMNPGNYNIGSAASYPTNVPSFNAIAGPGFLTYVGGDICVTNSRVWITNVSASLGASQTVNITFSIAGGSNRFLPYDVFATGALAGSLTNAQWGWMGQGYSCNRYTLNLANSAAYLILGTAQDTDMDGLTDAYELLVSHTDPNNPDTSGDGMLDGWKVLWGLSTSANNVAQTTTRANYSYNFTDWLKQVTGICGESVGLDPEGNVTGN